MGKLLYGAPATELEIDDRLLAHLKLVIVAKLRRNEGFMLLWEHSPAEGSGRESLWMHPSIPLQFHFLGSKRPALNTEWLDVLMASANTADGLRITPEPAPQRP